MGPHAGENAAKRVRRDTIGVVHETDARTSENCSKSQHYLGAIERLPKIQAGADTLIDSPTKSRNSWGSVDSETWVNESSAAVRQG